jgi:hypothetical protein
MADLPKDFKDMNNYQKGYAEGLDYEQKGSIGKKLDDVLEGAMPLYGRRGKVKTGFEQGVSDMKKAKESESKKKYAKGGSVGSASKRADGCATKGKTKGRII